MTGVQDPQRSGDSSGESHKQRIDRELMELLNELRVALPGVQFLFAFLLVVPFQQRGADLTDFQRDVYFATLLAAAVATGLLIAPAAQHRVLFRQHDKEALLRRSNRSAFLSLTVLALAIAGAVLLVTDRRRRGCPAALVVDRRPALEARARPSGRPGRLTAHVPGGGRPRAVQMASGSSCSEKRSTASPLPSPALPSRAAHPGLPIPVWPRTLRRADDTSGHRGRAT
jgi:hypothetical protein